MKKIMPALIVITVLVCTLTSCFLFESFELMYDESEISKIQIVKLLEYDESKGEYNIEIISTVKNNSEFLSEFKSLKSHSFIGDPIGVDEGDVVIKITYKNGEYEMINYSGAGAYRIPENGAPYFSNHVGFHKFDSSEFDALINKYSK